MSVLAVLPLYNIYLSFVGLMLKVYLGYATHVRKYEDITESCLIIDIHFGIHLHCRFR